MSKIEEQAPAANKGPDAAGVCPVAHKAIAAAMGGCPVSSALRASSLARSSSTSGSMQGRRVSFQANELLQDDRPHKSGVDSPSYKTSNAVSMKKIVDDLYRRVLADERLSPFYEHINMVRLKNQQEKVMMMIFGGQDLMEEEAPTLDLRVLHLKAIATQGLSTNHWQWFVDHLQETLDSMPEIPTEARLSAMAWIKTTEFMFKPLTDDEKKSWNATHPDQLVH